MHPDRMKVGARATLLGCSALVSAALATPALAQATTDQGATLGEIVVTAQKREQSLQDVPIAVTAVTQETLQTNRIATVQDLTALAPNLTVLNTAGGVGIPTFGMRGLVSAGSVAGQDRSVGLYLDGVSIGSALGSVFELPDVERIEVLRGPQGTLFGRNSTGGAVSVITRDPSGQFSLRQELTYGNYEQFRSVTRIETPTWGPLSASVSYTHDERKGDIKNLGAGQVWNRVNAGMGAATSPKTLGDKNSDAWFAALKFEPNDNFNTVYKFDWLEKDYTAEGTAVTAFTPESALGPAFGGIVRAIYNANPVPIAGADRPKYVNNNWVIPGYQKVWGHNITTNLRINDQLSLKNILAYRQSYIFSPAQITGLGGLRNIFSFLGAVGEPYVVFESEVQNRAKQWSEEIQLNYDSKFVTLTAGANYFHLDSLEGAVGDTPRNVQFSVLPGGVIPIVPTSVNIYSAKSYAAYAQAEVHLLPKLDVVGGYRLTQDKKSGTNIVDGTPFAFVYKKTKPSYLVGVNYKPTENLLAYAKYASGFVAGGVTSTIQFAPETVRSWEGGVKADLLDRRLRLNLAAFTAKYKNLQAVSGGAFLPIPRPELGTIVVTQGDLKTKGFEAEVSVAPMRGLTFDGSVGYTDWTLSNLNPLIGTPTGYRLNYRAHWTGDASVRYESEPLFGEARLMARLSGNYRSKMRMITQFPIPSGYDSLAYSPAGWVVNGRLALRNIELGRGNLEVGLWGKNLADSDRVMFPINFSFVGSTTYEAARTFGVDVIYNY